MLLKLEQNQRFRSGISAAEQNDSAEDDLLNYQHGAEKSAFASEHLQGLGEKPGKEWTRGIELLYLLEGVSFHARTD